MNIAIWVLMVQACLGAFDTLYYHEYKLKLPHGEHTSHELRLHALRDFLYALIIGSLAWVTWHGPLVWILVAALGAEIIITLCDFVEEDRVRKLPAGERVMHSIMGIVYGAFLALLVPEMLKWKDLPTGFGFAYHGFPGWVLSLVAAGVFVSGVRDLIASLKCHRIQA
jgi:phosphatidylglycerophosphate synthase